MDEPAQNEDIHLDGDQTQPTGEIIAALNQNGSSNSIKTEADLDSPTSEFDALFSRLSENPHDPEGWKRLIELATNSGEIPKIQKAYDELLKHYPNTVSSTKIFEWTRGVFMEFDSSHLPKLPISATS